MKTTAPPRAARPPLATHRWAALLAALAAGCTCGQRTQQRSPKLEVLDATGSERTSVDFGKIQIATTGEAKVRLRNSGTAVLDVTKAEFSDAKFGVTNLPLSLDVNSEAELALTFTPVDADLRVPGTVTLSSNDPVRPTVTLQLIGTGVAAAAVVTPDQLDFGEVYVGEAKALTVSLTNAGSNDLPVQDARLTAQVPAAVTGDLTPLKKTFAAGDSAQASLLFRPTALPTPVTGALEIVLGGQYGTRTVPLKGQAVQALPRLCFKWDDSPLERCTDQVTTSLYESAGALCDARVYPPDGGTPPCRGVDGGVVGYARGGRLYFRNDGNTPLWYALRYQSQQSAVCDAGSTIDLEFSNAPRLPDGGLQAIWTEPKVKVPAALTDPRPWETAPVTLTYRARSACPGDTADQAFVTWNRQDEPAGTNRLPQSLTFIVNGTSLLPKGVNADNRCTASGSVGTCDMPFVGVASAGTAPLRVTRVTLWQGEPLADGGFSAVPFEQCGPTSGGNCPMFDFAPGQDPNRLLPLTLPGVADPSTPASQTLGTLTFGDGGTAPLANVLYTVYAVIDTDDPYSPQVISTFRGQRQ